MASLDHWISEQKGADGKPLGNAEFGRRVAASEATISRVRNGKQAASLALMKRIEAATSGAVTPNDLARLSPVQVVFDSSGRDATPARALPCGSV